MIERMRSVLSPNRPWLHLVYLGFFFFAWLYQPPSLDQALVALVAMAGFVALYIFSLRRRDWTVYLGALAAGVLGYAFMPVTIGGAVYLVFAAAMLGWLPHSRRRTAGLLAVALAILSTAWLMQQPLVYVIALLILAGIAAAGAAMGARRQRQEADGEARQRQASALAAEAERQRIARDLHDLLGHTLSVVTLKADLASRLFDADPERARRELAEIQSISRTALAEVREAVAGLRGRSLDTAAREARLHLEAAGLAVSLELEADALTRGQSTALAMVVREAATNILRHAGARHAMIRTGRDEGGVALTISDDGRGGARIGEGGLGGLAARIEALSGRFTIDAAPAGAGTVVSVWLPAGEEDGDA
ncbi:sensor histidine kinase [Maricaulis salignorans]|uniref:sensor histidine kinase n=1 Tax=Maricaulis salignorans TaxID=144026 RepID=UPI003A8F7E11